MMIMIDSYTSKTSTTPCYIHSERFHRATF
jgi:hypothetical protein